MTAELPQSARPRRILSIDGGGIRCMIALEILLALEKQIIEQTGDPSRRLSDQFDLIAGTSAGAILAGAIAMGSSVADVRDFVLANSKLMFKPTRWYSRCLLYTSPSPRDATLSRMPSSA